MANVKMGILQTPISGSARTASSTLGSEENCRRRKTTQNISYSFLVFFTIYFSISFHCPLRLRHRISVSFLWSHCPHAHRIMILCSGVTGAWNSYGFYCCYYYYLVLKGLCPLGTLIEYTGIPPESKTGHLAPLKVHLTHFESIIKIYSDWEK